MRVITVGTSLICSQLIAGFKEVGIEVFACVGRDRERTKDFALKNGVGYHTSDYQKALTVDKFDTVYLAIPNSLHYEYAKLALEYGKNVIVEKPFCCSLNQAKELCYLANKKNLFIFDANVVSHNLAYKQLRDDVFSLGKIRMVELNYSKYSSKYDDFIRGETPNIFSAEYGGGALMDLGIYNIEFALGLFDMPSQVTYFPNMQRGVDTSGVAILQYPDFIVTAINGKDANRGSLFNICGEFGQIIGYQDVNEFNSYTIKLNNGEEIVREFPRVGKYYYELCDFKLVFDHKDMRKNNEYLTLTLKSIKTLELLKKNTKIAD